jgi:hypothetical protein
MIKVQGHEGLFRDKKTGAIINIEKPNRNNLSTKLSLMESDINTLKNELSAIKGLLKELIRNGDSKNRT